MNLIALTSASYRNYFIGSVAAVNGMWILRIVMAWMAWQVSGNASFVGFVAALSLIPTMICGPIFGVLVDRMNIKYAAYGTTIGMVFCTLIILFTVWRDQVTPSFIAMIALTLGIVTSAHHPMRLSLGPRLVSRTQISSVVALGALNFNIARVIAPFLAGVLIETYGIITALCVTLVLYLPNLILLRHINPRENSTQALEQSIGTALREGLTYLWARQQLRLILISTAVMSVSLRALLEVLPIIADGVFERGAGGLGHLGAAVGAGSLLAALGKTIGPSKATGAFSLPSIALFGLAVIMAMILCITTHWGMALFAAGVMGLTSTQMGVTYQTEFQNDLPDSLRGRVMSIWSMVAMGTVAIGTLLIGILADMIGLPATGLIIECISLALLAMIVKTSRLTPKTA